MLRPGQVYVDYTKKQFEDLCKERKWKIIAFRAVEKDEAYLGADYPQDKGVESPGEIWQKFAFDYIPKGPRFILGPYMLNPYEQ